MAKFDVAKTDVVMKLFETPRDARDDGWRARFLDAIVDASMAAPERQVMQGPDGFPYFVLERPPIGQAFTPFCVSHVLEHCTDRGFGIVVDPTERGPEWVFTYGDLFGLRAYGSFEGDPADRNAPRAPAGPDVLQKDTQVMIGAPSDAILPPWARPVIAAFIKQAANVAEPRVLLMMESGSPTRNLVFNIHPENFPSRAAFERVMNALGWFMPANRACVAVSQSAGFADAFVPLV
jgi:hypothetical protein